MIAIASREWGDFYVLYYPKKCITEVNAYEK